MTEVLVRHIVFRVNNRREACMPDTLPEFRVDVACGDKTFAFLAFGHLTRSAKDRLMGTAFYEADPEAGLFEGDHYELELVTPVWTFDHANHIHFHTVSPGRHFMCYTRQLPDIESAKRFFKMWAVGTAYTELRGEPFGRIFQDCNFSTEATIKLIEERFQIKIID